MKNLAFPAATAALFALPLAAHAQNAKVCFEAEHPIKIQSPLRIVMGQGSAVSGGGYLEIPWDQNRTKGIGSATYVFNAPVAGVYLLWSRCYWANGCGNSILTSVNTPKGGAILGKDGTYDAWHWVGGRARVKLGKGRNTLVLHNRETGVRVDQFFLCQDPFYIPQGIRKDTK